MTDACAHPRVEYRPVGDDKIGCTLRWICVECGREFAPTEKHSCIRSIVKIGEGPVIHIELTDGTRLDVWQRYWGTGQMCEAWIEVRPPR